VSRAPGLVGLVLVAALSACASQPATPDTPRKSTPSRSAEDCVFSLSVGDWTALDTQRLILYGPGSRQPYLVKLAFPSQDLVFGETIGVQDGDGNGRICGWGFDAILVAGGMPERMPIASVQKLSKEEAAALIAAARPPRRVRKSPIPPVAVP
jgi:hypothetical protein